MPRTLEGVGGRRYLNVPGVFYPETIFKAKPGYNPKSGLPYTCPPPWGITSRQAADILGCTISAARSRLHHAKVKFQIVLDGKSPRQVYWNKKGVEKLAATRLPLVSKMSPRLVDSTTAMKLLNRKRTALYRYTLAGHLHPVVVRSKVGNGVRIRNYYLKAEVLKLRHYIRAIEIRNAELQRFLARNQLTDREKGELKQAINEN